jgi:hypothetical protein
VYKKQVSIKTILLATVLLMSISVFSQQNFINVPSSEVTTVKKIFFQQQLNFNELIQSNTTLDFGLGNGFEIGVNVLGLNFSENQQTFFHNDSSDIDPYNPLISINALKQIKIKENIAISFGTQLGLNFETSKKKSEASLGYGNLSIKDLWKKNSNLIIGAYYNSKHYGGQGNRVGAWVGAEIPMIKKIHFMAESVIGNNSLSYTSFGIIYYPIKWMPLTFGVSIPNTPSNSYSLVFELTIIPGVWN